MSPLGAERSSGDAAIDVVDDTCRRVPGAQGGGSLLCAYHIELLTGQPAEQVLDAVHDFGIAVRVGALSPWRQRLRAETEEG